jgi:hypothetical protein
LEDVLLQYRSSLNQDFQLALENAGIDICTRGPNPSITAQVSAAVSHLATATGSLNKSAEAVNNAVTVFTNFEWHSRHALQPDILRLLGDGASRPNRNEILSLETRLVSVEGAVASLPSLIEERVCVLSGKLPSVS